MTPPQKEKKKVQLKPLAKIVDYDHKYNVLKYNMILRVHFGAFLQYCFISMKMKIEIFLKMVVFDYFSNEILLNLTKKVKQCLIMFFKINKNEKGKTVLFIFFLTNIKIIFLFNKK